MVRHMTFNSQVPSQVVLLAAEEDSRAFEETFFKGLKARSVIELPRQQE